MFRLLVTKVHISVNQYHVPTDQRLTTKIIALSFFHVIKKIMRTNAVIVAKFK